MEMAIDRCAPGSGNQLYSFPGMESKWLIPLEMKVHDDIGRKRAQPARQQMDVSAKGNLRVWMRLEFHLHAGSCRWRPL